MTDNIICKDGVRFRVYEKPPGRILVDAGFRDRATDTSGLGAYQTIHVAGELSATHEGMPVEVVRAYARAHGSVAEAGATALALLQRLPTAAALAEAKQGAEGGALDAPFPQARGPDMAGGTAGEAPAGALDQREPGGSPALELDALTTEIIEARKILAGLDASFHPPGKARSDQSPELVAWYHRATSGAAYASRLIIVTQPRFARHPLLQEGIDLRARLQAIVDEARAELPDARKRALGIKVNATDALAKGVSIPVVVMVRQPVQQQQANASPSSASEASQPVPASVASIPTAIPVIYGSMPDEEVAHIVREMWSAGEPTRSPEEAWSNATADIERAAEDAHRETVAWLALHELQFAGQHVDYGVAFNARARLQDAHTYYADLIEIAAIGSIGTGWHLRPNGRGRYGLAEDGADVATMIVPRGLSAEGYWAIVRAYRTGIKHGRLDLQRNLRTLLGVGA